jgi:hypothetical protein
MSHLSGPNKCAHTQTFHRGSRPAVAAHVATVTFITHTSLNLTYSHMCMDSLVRVSRRVIWHLAGQHREENRLSEIPWQNCSCQHGQNYFQYANQEKALVLINAVHAQSASPDSNRSWNDDKRLTEHKPVLTTARGWREASSTWTARQEHAS